MRKKNISKVIYILLHGIGFVLLFFVIRNLDVKSFWLLLIQFPVWKFLLGLGMLLGVYLLKSIRWFLINKSFNIHVSYSVSLTYFLVSGFLSAITPGRIGEFAKIYFLKEKQNVSLSLASSSVIVDRIWDVLVLSLVTLCSLVFLLKGFSFSYGMLIIIIMLFLASLIVILVPSIFFTPALWLTKRWKKFHEELHTLQRLWTSSGKKYFIASFFLTLAAFLLLSLIPLIFAPEVNAQVPLSASIGAVSLSNILSFIPVSVAGFGTREFVFIRIWGLFSHSPEAALTISTAQFLCTYGGSILIGGLIYLLRFRRHFSFREIRNEPNMTSLNQN